MKNKTSLCIGPVSKNGVDAVLEITNEFNIPISLVLSRNQIETEKIGHGYVNNWTTEEFSNYVSSKDINQNVVLARDHGGPWQNDSEKYNKISFDETWDNTKKSFISDIDSGFKILHIDPTIDLFSKLSIDDKIDRICKLCKFCSDECKKRKQKIQFEISLWEDGASENNNIHMEHAISKIFDYCNQNSIDTPSFFAIPTGNKVVNSSNAGLMKTINFDTQIYSELSKTIQICKKFAIKTKVHGTDYLPDESLQWFPKLNIDAANIAPELGTVETTALLNILKMNGLNELKSKFLELSYSSKKWAKWISEDHALNKNELGIIAGHYVFPSDEFRDLKTKIQSNLDQDLDKYLIKIIKENILRYLKNFNLLC